MKFDCAPSQRCAREALASDAPGREDWASTILQANEGKRTKERRVARFVNVAAGQLGLVARTETVARCTTKGDEIALARCDIDLCNSYKRSIFNFDVHREPRAYGLIVERKGVTIMADGTPVGPKG
ncbi:hypothetical protein AC630_40105 [Bradyrhizobium sp. AS23.2]|nr:hypothetical protein AC630_40105 [Bradyrhizobium sp. AS23.2]